MGIVKDINNINKEYKKSIKNLLNKLKDLIDNLPDNNKIKPLGDFIFIMNYKDLNSKNWSPEHYHFRWQYNKVYDVLINTKDTTYIANRLEKIIEKGEIVINYNMGSYYKSTTVYKLHPEVIKNLKKIL